LKVLLDENLPHRLRSEIAGHEVMTVGYRGWTGVRNGSLIAAAEQDGFNVLVTGDQNIAYQQNVAGRTIAIVTLSAVNWPILRHHLVAIQLAVDHSVPGSFQQVDCGVFRR
jgi:predicted nuclease of predicted toxin-antitoxin system